MSYRIFVPALLCLALSIAVYIVSARPTSHSPHTQEVSSQSTTRASDDPESGNLSVQPEAVKLSRRTLRCNTKEEVKQIRSLNGIKFLDTTPENLSQTGLHGSTYVLTAYRVQNSSAEFVGAEIVHESYHTMQWNYNCGNAERFERNASSFTVGVISKLGFALKVLEAFQEDALRGHTPCVKPKRKK